MKAEHARQIPSKFKLIRLLSLRNTHKHQIALLARYAKFLAFVSLFNSIAIFPRLLIPDFNYAFK